MHSSPYLYVCGDDRMIYYSRADDLTGEPGDAWDWSARSYGLLKTWYFDVFMFWTLAILGFYSCNNFDCEHLQCIKLCDFDFPAFWEHVFINEELPILSYLFPFI